MFVWKDISENYPEGWTVMFRSNEIEDADYPIVFMLAIGMILNEVSKNLKESISEKK